VITSIKIFIAILLLGSSTVLYSADVVFEFENKIQEQRYSDLIDELRCLVCQNQSLADSHAELAQDLRNEVYEKIIGGESDDTIIKFLVERYGDFVLYRPPLQQKTWILWFGPVLAMVLALFAVSRIISRGKTDGNTAELSNEEKQQLANLLDKSDTGSGEEKC
jgi:cytochrome c-type biogenesis protein CcmH